MNRSKCTLSLTKAMHHTSTSLCPLISPQPLGHEDDPMAIICLFMKPPFLVPPPCTRVALFHSKIDALMALRDRMRTHHGQKKRTKTVVSMSGIHGQISHVRQLLVRSQLTTAVPPFQVA
mmetsp:Transcript_45053/g.111899  ORF Transcript_45053/g.111899 Transcript_45053/m.111899 type:complete len:120 (-) Transcript_45053:619-978(-)